VPGFSSLKARRLRSLLERELGYKVVSNSGGSHRKMQADGRPAITLAFHDGQTIGPHLVRDILVKEVGLSIDEARKVASYA
jgi:predicted RNA binding protein YcfA (HicA-like mRNA interferase family)